MLRLKGESDDEILDEELTLSDRITARDAFPDEHLEVDEADEAGAGQEPERGTSLIRGLGIATATFVPTFLVILFGLPYLLDSPTPARNPSTPIPADLGAPATSRPSGTIRDPFLAPSVVEPPATRATDPRESARLREAVRGSIGESAPPAAVEPPPSTPALPPGQPRPAEPSSVEPRPVEPREPEPPRQAAAPRPAPERVPAPEPSKSAPGWAPAAAFTDREAANRLASSIQQQGYPVEIRQDRSSTRPWVVWIGAAPRAGARRR